MSRDRYNPTHTETPSHQATQQSSSLMGIWIKACVWAMLLSVVMIIPLRFVAPSTSAFMLRQHLDDLLLHQRWQTIQHHWTPRSDISQYAFAAVLASEDQRFYKHHGFDLQAMLKAYAHNAHSKKIRGASTISQQVAKNLFLSPTRSYVRKALEVWFTAWLELLWPKQRILEIYLNIAEFGDHLFGIEAASRHYFGVSAAQLSAQQAALLAAVLPNPHLLKADKPSAYLVRRQRWILNQMRQFL